MLVWRLRIKKRGKLVGSGEQWWRASSKLTPVAIKRAFKEERVGGILYDTVRAIQPTCEYLWHRKVILIKIEVPSHRVDKQGIELCLSEIGVHLISQDNKKRQHDQELHIR